jgi:hypothetical protein
MSARQIRFVVVGLVLAAGCRQDTQSARGAVQAVGDSKPARHFEKAAGFSFVPPKGWTMTDGATLAKAAKAFQEKYAAATQRIKQQIQAQLKRARPGSFQEKVLKQQLAQLEKQSGQPVEKVGKSTTLERRTILVCSGPDDAGAASSITFDAITPAKGKVVKKALADAVAQYKFVANNTNPYSRVVAQTTLKTAAGAQCVVLETSFFPATYLGDTDDRVRLRITHYFVELSPGRILVATCSAASASRLNAVFEASLKTLRLEKP